MTKDRKRRRMQMIVCYFQHYVRTYSSQAGYDEYSDNTFIDDILYGLGIAMDKKKYHAADGFDQFKAVLRKRLTDKSDAAP